MFKFFINISAMHIVVTHIVEPCSVFYVEANFEKVPEVQMVQKAKVSYRQISNGLE